MKTNKVENIINIKMESFIEMSSDDLKFLHDSWYPVGSGPIGAMYAITALIRAVATLRGVDISEWSK